MTENEFHRWVIGVNPWLWYGSGAVLGMLLGWVVAP